MKVALVDTTSRHVDAVASRMRRCDREEIWASSRSRPRASLARGVSTSVLCRTGLVDGRPACIFGVAPGSLLTGHGCPWMLAASGVDRASRPLARLSLPVVEAMNEVFPVLTNYVDARNLRTLRWLEWLGFTVFPAEPHGVDGLPFHRFERRAQPRTSHV